MSVEMLVGPHVKCPLGVSGYSQHLHGHIAPNTILHEDMPYINRNEILRKTIVCSLPDRRRHELTTEELKVTPTVHTAI
jgi:hypothetical protein